MSMKALSIHTWVLDERASNVRRAFILTKSMTSSRKWGRVSIAEQVFPGLRCLFHGGISNEMVWEHQYAILISSLILSASFRVAGRH